MTTELPTITFSRHATTDTLGGVLNVLQYWTAEFSVADGDPIIGEITSTFVDGDTYVEIRPQDADWTTVAIDIDKITEIRIL